MSVIPPPPSQTFLNQTDSRDPVKKTGWFISKEWLIWILESLMPRLNVTSQVVLSPQSNGGTLTNQNTALPATSLAAGQLHAGTYRVTYYARKTQIDGVSSSLTVSIGWTEDALALTLTGPAMTADSVSAPQTGTIMVTIDQNSAITFSTAYASNTPGQMRYLLRFVVESLTP